MTVVVKILCVFALMCFLSRGADGKPFFGTDWWCDLFCDDDDYDDPLNPTTTTLEDLLDSMFDPCSDCRRPVRRRPAQNAMPFNVVLPPSQTGMNLTMLNAGGSWIMNVLPWGNQVTPAPAPAAVATPAPATTPAPVANTTAAPAAAG